MNLPWQINDVSNATKIDAVKAESRIVNKVDDDDDDKKNIILTVKYIKSGQKPEKIAEIVRN